MAQAQSPENPPKNPSEHSTEFDQTMMGRCRELARQALGKTAPNPMVGCVVVQDREIVGEGFHPRAGEPHAEVFALEAAGEKARGATVYVNLEPCNHYGRTPPCTEALIQAQVAEVVIGMVDPNPVVSGQGIQRLREAGIKVKVGVETAACQQLNEGFVHRILYQRPFGILKYAMTLDGKIATKTGHSAWVTSPAARNYVHHLRVACDAVIVGGNTVRRDDPHLTTHGVGEPNPLRVVMSRTLNLPPEAHLWETQTARTLVFTEWGIRPEMQQLLKQKGVEVIELSPLNPLTILDHLHQQHCLSVLWECGGVLAAQRSRREPFRKFWHLSPLRLLGVEVPRLRWGNSVL